MLLHIKKALSVLFMSVVILQPGFSESLENLIGTENARALRIQKTIKQVQLRDAKTVLNPKNDFTNALIIEAFAELKPNLIVETLYVYTKPKTANGAAWTKSEQLNLYNEIRSLSTLVGIEYYSASRKRMRTFYETSFVIADESGIKPIPDPVVMIIPEKDSLFAFQKDLTFGENKYRYDFRASSDCMGFIQENLTTMSYGFIPLLGAGRLRTVVDIVDLGSELLVYAVSGAQATLLPGIDGKVRDSFSNRADAIFGWFSKRADEAYSLSGHK